MNLKISLVVVMWPMLLFLTPNIAPAHSVEPYRQELIKKLSKHFDAEEINKIFSDERIGLDYGVLPPKPKKLTKKEAEKARLKAEDKRKNFMSGKSLERGVDYYIKHRDTLLRVSSVSGVDPYIIISILRNETNFGAFLNEPMLAINAMYSNYILRPKWRNFMLGEIICFLKESKKNSWGIFAIYGSMAGAIGYPQFVPCSIGRFAADGDGDGKIDLFSHADSIASVAGHLKPRWSYKWQNQHKAVLGYNQDDGYRDYVLEYREALIREIFLRELAPKKDIETQN